MQAVEDCDNGHTYSYLKVSYFVFCLVFASIAKKVGDQKH